MTGGNRYICNIRYVHTIAVADGVHFDSHDVLKKSLIKWMMNDLSSSCGFFVRKLTDFKSSVVKSKLRAIQCVSTACSRPKKLMSTCQTTQADGILIVIFVFMYHHWIQSRYWIILREWLYDNRYVLAYFCRFQTGIDNLNGVYNYCNNRLLINHIFCSSVHMLLSLIRISNFLLISSPPNEFMPDRLPESIIGPSIRFAGQPARWTGEPNTFQGQLAVEARVAFESLAGDRTTSFLDIENDGTTAIYYHWKVFKPIHINNNNSNINYLKILNKLS